jgi:hypothetical protein
LLLTNFPVLSLNSKVGADAPTFKAVLTASSGEAAWAIPLIENARITDAKINREKILLLFIVPPDR